jgi:hypothetical protein
MGWVGLGWGLVWVRVGLGLGLDLGVGLIRPQTKQVSGSPSLADVGGNPSLLLPANVRWLASTIYSIPIKFTSIPVTQSFLILP